MSTNEKNKNWLIVILSIVLMVGGSILLSWTLNDLYGATSALVTLLLALSSVFIYILGAALIGRGVRKTKINHHPKNELEDGIMFAFLLIAAGALMICFNTELLEQVWKPFFLSWQMLVFVVGAIGISRLHFIWGTLFSAAGVFFLVEKATVIYPNIIQQKNFTATYWPIIFIVLGIVIVLSYFIRPKKGCGRHLKGNWIDDYVPNENENDDGKINYRFVLSGTEQVILDPVFKGGSIETVLGGVELDLRRTSLAEGKTMLYINNVLGGVEIAAPDNWDIEIVSKTFAGGVFDSRRFKTETDSSRKLVIMAKCILGGITIK